MVETMTLDVKKVPKPHPMTPNDRGNGPEAACR